MKYLTSLLLLIALSITGINNKLIAQDPMKSEGLLTSKKWVCLDVSRAKLGKMDFKFEIGNELSMRIDKKYSFKNNDYNFQAGTWKLDGKTLYFFYDDPSGDSRIVSTRYQIQKLKPEILKLKRLDKPRGKLIFK